MAEVPIEKCIAGAWRDTLCAIEKMPILFFVMFGVSLGMVRIEHITHLHAALHASGRLPYDVFYAAPYFQILANHGGNIGEPILAIPVIRFAINGDVSRLSSISFRVYGRCFAISIVLAAVVILAIAIVQVAEAALPAGGVDIQNNAPATQTLLTLRLIAVAYVFARGALLFPHVALGGRMNWQAAWFDTHGQALRVACIYGIGSLIPGYLLTQLFLPLLHQSFASASLDLFAEALVRLFMWTLSSATLAWIYRKYARTIRLAGSMTRGQMAA
jgi:hypothetical protein